ncbi:shikimate dehydrogenase [Lachnospiraceae bacterium MD329]|nr:shikimate dehydrogenase [Lachnospiraceae bacterium MD329]
MIKIDGHTQHLGIIGYPIEHTFSPAMHNFISEAVHNNFIYSAYLIPPEQLENAINAVRALDIKGINVTAPHKVEVMQYLDEVTDTARELGSVNTVVNRGGKLYGYNTDADGFCMMLEKNDIAIKGSNILIIGAGGVTRPTVIRLIDNGASAITVLNRTKEKADSLADDIMKVKGFKINTTVNSFDFDIVINTTSAGMEPQENALPTDSISEISDLSFINENTAVVDMIYNPSETRFLKESRERGAKTLNGLGMLIYQGIIAYELFTDTKLPSNIGELIQREVFNR